MASKNYFIFFTWTAFLNLEQKFWKIWKHSSSLKTSLSSQKKSIRASPSFWTSSILILKSSRAPAALWNTPTHNQTWLWHTSNIAFKIRQATGQRSWGQRSPVGRTAAASGAHHLCGCSAVTDELFWSECETHHGCCQHTLYTHTHTCRFVQ